MECSDAMRIVSERLDKAQIDASDLDAAKEHCRSCPSCAAYVRALVAVERVPAPEPPASIVDDIMARVRAEAAAAAPEPLPEQAESVSAGEAPGPAVPISARLRDPRTRIRIAAWAGVAAVMFIGAGFVALSGSRQILTPATRSTGVSSQAENAATDSSANGAALNSNSAAPAPDSSAETAGRAPGYIVVGTTVYRTSGAATGVDEAALQPKGTTTTELDQGPPAASREVLGLQDPARVYLRADDGSLLAFDRVSRSYNGQVYVLQSSPIDAFGQWPTPPGGVRLPSAAQGTLGMTESGTDDSGVTVYVPSGTSATSGIAIPPATSAGDPAAGNPEWTWWVPAS